MKAFNYLGVLLPLLFLIGACSKDSTDESSNDIAISLDEYPASGTTVAVLTSNLSGTTTYSIQSESVNGAFAINQESGSLTVGNSLAFDFEINETITALVNASNGTDTESIPIEVSIDDIDDIEFVLSDSKSDYQSAMAGEWLEISKKEYDSLFTIINSINLVGSSEDDYNGAARANSFEYHSNRTVANFGNLLPKGEYLFAFKYISGATEVNAAKVKISETSVTSGYQDFGSVLPNHGADEVYFILKGNDTNYTNDTYLAMYSDKSIAWDPFFQQSTVNHIFRSGDTNILGGDNMVIRQANTVCTYQGLSTPIKQWK
ncbi:cadherin repeat domain-containing protein [Poritiphilus flavus]|uniref:Cadherin domain-containing protein n=1 Tax=Poritiphilus flavus TaxID=2697053 RepID=A0A6L9EF16_9FLAO|nr:cadherin repeat domain-containing protein [Poritiphilus flavus]NAS13162.1 hypothetical protein [Poritiphilus flavus]